MADQTITCPKCGEQIPLNDALTGKIREQLKGEIEKRVLEREKQLATKEKALAESQKNIDEQVRKKLDTEKAKIMAEAKEEAGKKLELEMQNLKKSDEEKEKQLEEMRKQAIAFMDKARELETKDKNRELEFAQKMDEERGKIAEQAKKETLEEVNLKAAEKDKQMEQMRKTIEDLKRKSEQGSTQIQGDAQEAALKEILQGMFPIDSIEDVPTGVNGADLIQAVNNSLGQKTGVILWESKNTQKWDNKWIAKLKGDQALVKADVCILVSQSMPEGLENFGLKDGVWVCSYKFALALAGVLRLNLIQIGQIKQSLVGKDQKMELLYNYLSGSEFYNRIENIVSAFTSMKVDLETERRSMQRIWNKRAKEIDRVVDNTSCMYGDLQGIIGALLPTIQALALPSGEDEGEMQEEERSI
ncbi:MAG: DUF2130 domain-containing protein [Patescibacteria group bacterium]|nr:DUF2130 domain-containing protein [Patescibacteria group bacterium]